MTGLLSTYRSKRNFALTPEPSEGGSSQAGVLQFVIQKHWASRLHYDLRLELDGVMKSWAVPKGPSLDPHVKRMAVQVEDHPMAYNRFEGQIPAGQYGAGKVIIWDKGSWVPLNDPEAGYRNGKLEFELQGHKLKGRWVLVRMHGREGERQPPWLLIKESDEEARREVDFNVVAAMPDSVAHVAKPLPSSRRKKASPRDLPESLSPQLAVLAEAPPLEADGWAWELKFDGYRVLARKQGDQVRLFTRNGKDWTGRMPAIVKVLETLPNTACWIDGEVVALDANGSPDFQRLQNAFDGSEDAELIYFAFDLLFDEGVDLRDQSWSDRRERLEAVIGTLSSDAVRISEVFDALPTDLLSSACSIGFEGIMGKRVDARYQPRRSADWIKLKCQQRQEFVILGYTDPKGSRTGLGALLLGVHRKGDGALRYVGNVGSGFNEQTLRRLHKKLSGMHMSRPPAYAREVDALHRSAHWVEPTLLAEVSFAEWTNEGRLRHPVFHGLSDDKPASAIRRETPMKNEDINSKGSTSSTVAKVQISHPERVVDAQTGLTKLDVVRYYAKVAPLMMEHLKSRPVALMRAPDGVEGEQFFQKHLANLDIEGMQQLDAKLDPGHAPLMAVVKPDALVHAAQMNVIEFHTWNARKDRIDRPDRMTFDLDPGEGVPWLLVQEGAQLVKVLLDELGLASFLKTSGGKGLHIVVPIQRRYDWDAVKGFSKAVVQHLAETIPERFVAKSGPQNRKGRIFVDYLRNGRGATTVCAWSARARPGLGVSVPVAWSELDKINGGAHWTVGNMDDRLRLGNSVWDAYDSSAVSLSAPMKQLGFDGSSDF